MKRAAVLALLAIALLPTVPADADDASLRAAGRSRDAEFERLGDQTRRTHRAWVRSGHSRRLARVGDQTRRTHRAWVRSGHSRRLARRLIRLDRRTRSEIEIVQSAVQAEEPSTPGGATYERRLLRSLRHFDAALSWDARGIRAFMQGRRDRASAAWRRAQVHFARSVRLERRAVRAIEG